MQPHLAAKLIGIHPNTVRTWTADQRYRRFFSLSAQGGSGQERDITETDIRILAYINQLKDQGRQADEVEASLVQAEQAGFENLPMPRANGALVPTPVIPVQAAEQALIAERRMIARLEQDIEEYKQRLERSNSEREEYLRKLIAAETELKMWRDGWRPPVEG